NFNLTGGHVMPSLMRRIHLGKLLENGDMGGIRADLQRRLVRDLTAAVPMRKYLRFLTDRALKV
ncbi:MAG: hypothetical protein V3571_04595, partial [Pseudodesulfovibrio sp.]